MRRAVRELAGLVADYYAKKRLRRALGQLVQVGQCLTRGRVNGRGNSEGPVEEYEGLCGRWVC